MTEICLIGFVTQMAAMPLLGRLKFIQVHKSMAIVNAFRLGLCCLCMYNSSNETQPEMPPSLYMIIDATIYPESQLVYPNQQSI
jgi:hypothetical protein